MKKLNCLGGRLHETTFQVQRTADNVLRIASWACEDGFTFTDEEISDLHDLIFGAYKRKQAEL